MGPSERLFCASLVLACQAAALKSSATGICDVHAAAAEKRVG